MADITQISNKSGDNSLASVCTLDDQSGINTASSNNEPNQSVTDICIVDVASQSQMHSLDLIGQCEMEITPEKVADQARMPASSLDAGHQADTSKLGDQSTSPQKEHTDTSESVEMDSPTKTFEEFRVLIGETEASMRDKLSSLTLPDSESFEQEEKLNIPVAKELKTGGQDEGVKVKDDSSVPLKTAESNTEDVGQCNVNNRTDGVSIVTDMPSIESENNDDTTFQPAVMNVVSNAQGEDDKADDVRVEDMTGSIESEALQCNESHKNDVAEKRKGVVPNKECEMMQQQNVLDSEDVGETNMNGSHIRKENNQPVNIPDQETEIPTGEEVSAKSESDNVLSIKTKQVDEISNQMPLNNEIEPNTQMVESDSSKVTQKISSNDKDVILVNKENQSAVFEDKAVTDPSGNVILPNVSSVTESKVDTDKELDTENIELMDITDEVHTEDNQGKKKVSDHLDTGVKDQSAVEQQNKESKPVGEKDAGDGISADCEKNSNETIREIKTVQGNDKEKEVTEVDKISCGTDDDVEDNLMIIDVRSLTDNSGINDFNDKNESISKEKSGTENMDNLDENQGPKVKPSEEVIKDITSAERPHSSASSRSKRKSPNSVRRITEHVESAENMSPLSESSATSSAIMTERTVGESGDITAVNQSESSSVPESLPIISNTFSMKDNLQPNITVKDEPPDDGVYGVIQGAGNIPQTHKPTFASLKPNAMTMISGNSVIHKGQVVSHGISGLQKSGRPLSSQKLVISKVPPIVSPAIAAVSLVSSAPVSLIRYPLTTCVTKPSPKVQSVPNVNISAGNTAAIVTLRNLAPRSAAPAPVQNGNILTGTKSTAAPKDKTKESNHKNLSTINIHSVGVARITDLIARKNPIPTFKPNPIPDHLASIQSSKVYPCYECGDSFHFEKSLRQHLGRCSMNIFYKCEKCVTKIKFTNKCQLLNHLRSHLNIEKTQAVPIHIKSDSIEIVTNFDAISADKPFEWYKEENVAAQVSIAGSDLAAISCSQCLECSTVFVSLKKLEDHLKGVKSDHHFCDECPLYVNSKCALQAHKKLHLLDDVKCNKSLSIAQWSFLKTLSCPECGKHFARDFNLTNVNGLFNTMALHLKNVCFHLSRLPAFKCTKCLKVFQNFEGLRNHLNTRLEHYYKCGLCPMALKSLKSLESHYEMKHKLPENSDQMITPGMSDKIIYRCHICDTLIDDKSFLVQHIDKHLDECKKYPDTHYHCLQCGQMFMKRNDLVEHYSKHVTVRRQFWCTFCSKDKVRAIPYIGHILKFHTSSGSHLATKSVVKFCNSCGLVCIGEHMFQNHACLAARNTTVIVGDRSEQNKVHSKTKPQGRKEIASSARDHEATDLPPNVSKTCHACSAIFASQAQRESHLKDHRDYDLIFICKFCDKEEFKSYHELRSHEIACKAMNDMPKEKQNGGQKKEGTAQYRKIKSKSETHQQKKVHSATKETKSYVDGVELTPKESSKSSKSKQETVEYFMCDKCDAVFTRKSKQEEHIKSEHGIHPCHLCGLMHESQSSLKKHLMVDHEGKRMLLYCGVCKSRKIEKAFNLRGKLIKHLKVKHRMKVIDESKIITQLPGLPETLKETTPEYLKRKLSESPETSVKKLRIEGESDFKCAKCLFTCNVKSEFRLHILDHKAAETYQCFECGLCFAVLPSLRKHVFMVHKVRDFDSYMAENEIKEPTALEDKDVDIIRVSEPDKHEEMDESSEEEASGDPLECKVCYRTFDNEKVLKSHMRTHGMAFIKKSRRRAQNISPVKKVENEVTYSSSQDEGKQEGLVLKLKRLKPADAMKGNSHANTADTEASDVDVMDTGEDDTNEMDVESVSKETMADA
ncbi:zinc finger protein 532-like isoform X2 [Ruditapes philippinarum]|nr:zinc finger protein 532-like isoform X2 [Ruditapes philippinarum]